MADMEITLVKFGNAETVVIPEGSTLADVLAGRDDIDSDAAIRFRGETVTGEGADIVLAPGDTVVAAPADVSHGN